MASSVCCRSLLMAKSIDESGFASTRIIPIGSGFAAPRVSFTDSKLLSSRSCGVRASMVDSYGSSDFVKRMEQAWEISQLEEEDGPQNSLSSSAEPSFDRKDQPTPIGCSSCNSNGHVECKWCAGTGFFVLGDNMLCQVPSRNTSCVICSGKGSRHCSDCKGTGYRARWLGEPPISK